MSGWPIDRSALERFCLRHGIRELSLFGSVLRPDFTESSDVDVLVEFGEDAHVSLFGLADMEAELSALLGRKADLVVKSGLRGRYREHILAHRQVQYVAPR